MTAYLSDFLTRPSWEVAPALLGWRLETRFGGVVTAVSLTEVEAYDQTDPASHSHRGRTPRTAAMFAAPGHLYVYRSYGIHWCMNVVTGPAGHGAAVLLRAGLPVGGADVMARRRGRNDHLADGPGKLTQALGIDGSHDGLYLLASEDVRLIPTEGSPVVIARPRVGITKAAEIPWRFVVVSDN